MADSVSMQRSSAPPGRRRSLAGALVLAFALAACGSGTGTTGTAAPSSAAPQAGNGAPASTATAPALPGGTATSAAAGGASATKAPADPDAPRLDADVLQGQAATIEGTSFDLGSLAGKDLVVWFWAPW